jgi:protein TonB
MGLALSVLIHALIIALIVVPLVYSRTIIERMEQGAGGRGPAGGGGGGSRGAMTTPPGYVETLRYVRVRAEPLRTPTSIPPVAPPVLPRVEPPKPQPPTPPVVAPQASTTPAATTVVASTAGTGAGTGDAGAAGAGTGSGGGTGSGLGTGKGNGVGPGTGGGTQANYPPQPIEFFLPPLPAPRSVQGFRFVAEFDVDSTGRVLDVKFSETPDGGYNRRIASVLHSMKFRPGTRPDGTALRMKAQLGYEF